MSTREPHRPHAAHDSTSTCSGLAYAALTTSCSSRPSRTSASFISTTTSRRVSSSVLRTNLQTNIFNEITRPATLCGPLPRSSWSATDRFTASGVTEPRTASIPCRSSRIRGSELGTRRLPVVGAERGWNRRSDTVRVRVVPGCSGRKGGDPQSHTMLNPAPLAQWQSSGLLITCLCGLLSPLYCLSSNTEKFSVLR
jgi:hypothetical protein